MNIPRRNMTPGSAQLKTSASVTALVAPPLVATHALANDETDEVLHFLSQRPLHTCREVLLELTTPVKRFEPIADLRIARRDDLNLIVPVHAALAFAESGVNPLDLDADGFRARCAHRVEQGRVYVLIENGKLIFKADVISDTPDVVYVEGLYVRPEHRGREIGTRCLAQMSRELLPRTKSIVGLVNEATP